MLIHWFPLITFCITAIDIGAEGTRALAEAFSTRPPNLDSAVIGIFLINHMDYRTVAQ